MIKLQLQEAVEENDKFRKKQSNAVNIAAGAANAEEEHEKLKYEAVDMKKSISK